MGKLVFGLLAVSICNAAITDNDLHLALVNAQGNWGYYTRINKIEIAPLEDDCKVMSAWADLVEKRITINSKCKLTLEMVNQVVLHEYGHLLTGQGHSLDPKSVMFKVVNGMQIITSEDRALAKTKHDEGLENEKSLKVEIAKFKKTIKATKVN